MTELNIKGEGAPPVIDPPAGDPPKPAVLTEEEMAEKILSLEDTNKRLLNDSVKFKGRAQTAEKINTDLQAATAADKKKKAEESGNYQQLLQESTQENDTLKSDNKKLMKQYAEKELKSAVTYEATKQGALYADAVFKMVDRTLVDFDNVGNVSNAELLVGDVKSRYPDYFKRAALPSNLNGAPPSEPSEVAEKTPTEIANMLRSNDPKVKAEGRKFYELALQKQNQ